MINRSITGQTLFELVIAIGVVVLVLAGIVHVVTTSIKNSTFAKNQSEATRYAKEAQEWLRQERDKNWNTFSGKIGTWCLDTLSWPGASLACSQSQLIPGTIFKRQGVITTVDSNTVGARVEVLWNDPSGPHKVSIDTRLSNWRLFK